MLKLFLNIILSLLLVFSTGGVNLYRHYCGEKLVSTSIDVRPDDCCEKGCKGCQTKVVNLKVKTNFVTAQNLVDFKQQNPAPVQFYIPVDLFACLLPHTDFSEKEIWLKHPHLIPLLAGDQEAFLQVFRV